MVWIFIFMTDRLVITGDLEPTFIESGDFKGRICMRIQFPDGQEKEAIFCGNTTIPEGIKVTTAYLNGQIEVWRMKGLEAQIKPAVDTSQSFKRNNGVHFEKPNDHRYSVWATQSDETLDYIKTGKHGRALMLGRGHSVAGKPSQI